MTFFYDLNKKLSDLADRQTLTEGKKPDFLDFDKDGDKKEPMKKAIKDKKVEQGVYKDAPKKSEVPAFARKAKGGDWKTSTKDLEKEKTASPTSSAGLARRKAEKGVTESEKKAKKDYDGDGKIESGKDEFLGSKIAAAKKAGKMSEGAKLVAIKESGDRKAKIYKDEQYGEYCVRVFESNTEDVNARFYTKNKDDALTVAKHLAEGWDDMIKHIKSRGTGVPKVGDVEHGHKHDIKHTATGRIVTRRVDPNTGHSVGAEDDGPADGEKRGRGRPKGKGAGKSIGAKGPSGKSKLMTREGPDDIEDQGEYDREGDMAQQDLRTAKDAADHLRSILDTDENLPEWVQAKITKAVDYLDTARDYMDSKGGNKELDEKAVSKKQQKFMGMVHATQKGEKAPSKEVAKVAKTMKKGDAEDFAATKHKGLPEKKKKKEVDETTVAGSVAPSSGPAKDPGSPKEKKSSGGGMVFGKGVYEAQIKESFNKKLNTVLTEGLNVNISATQGEDGQLHKSITVSAEGEDAERLAEILKLAGIDSAESGEACASCGATPCGCDTVAEDLANSPNPEYSGTDTMVNTLSGGLNGRKSTGQTTIPVVNHDPRRGSFGPTMENIESKLQNIYNRYDTK
jgi:hypothetical protein